MDNFYETFARKMLNLFDDEIVDCNYDAISISYYGHKHYIEFDLFTNEFGIDNKEWFNIPY